MDILVIGYAAALGVLIAIFGTHGWAVGCIAVAVFMLAHLLFWAVEKLAQGRG